jgi:hypothetical protein
MLPNITFNYGQGGLGRPLTGEDFISGLMFVNSSLPSGFSSTDRIKKVFSLAEAEALGINKDYSDETKATATYLVTTKATVADTFNLTCTTIEGTVKLITGYSFVTADAVSTATTAAAIAAEINAGTTTHGFTAIVTSSTVTITAVAGQGVFLNAGTPYVITTTGAIAGTLTQNVVAGIASKRAIEWYHVSEFFRLQSKGILYIAYYATYSASNVSLVRDYANGTIRQIGVNHDFSTAFATSIVSALQVIADESQTLYKPLSIVYNPEVSGTASLSALVDLTSLASKNVSVSIGQDGIAFGYKLWKATAKSIGSLGAVLGAVAASSVSESIAWVGKFNMSNGIELDTLMFGINASGANVFYNAVADSQLTSLNNYGYVFLRKLIGITGTYNTPPTTATLSSSDYHYIYSNRTIDKATRGVRASLLPLLSSPIKLNSNGTLTNTTIEYFISQASVNLDDMVRNEELSDFAVSIDSTQNVLSTNNITVAVQLLPIGVADFITVNIGFTTSI